MENEETSGARRDYLFTLSEIRLLLCIVLTSTQFPGVLIGCRAVAGGRLRREATPLIAVSKANRSSINSGSQRTFVAMWLSVASFRSNHFYNRFQRFSIIFFKKKGNAVMNTQCQIKLFFFLLFFAIFNSKAELDNMPTAWCWARCNFWRCNTNKFDLI